MYYTSHRVCFAPSVFRTAPDSSASLSLRANVETVPTLLLDAPQFYLNTDIINNEKLLRKTVLKIANHLLL
jgi:hypothetical protein